MRQVFDRRRPTISTSLARHSRCAALCRAIGSLRRYFGDPLLVRTARGYALTPVAERLRLMVSHALDSMNALFNVAEFDPSASIRTFRIASTDYGQTVALLPRLAKVSALAPGVSWQIDPWTVNTVARLARGEIDCALYADEALPPDFHVRTLFHDGYALACRDGHPLTALSLVDAKPLLEAAAKFPQCAPRYLSARGYVTDDVYRRLGLPPAKTTIASPYFASALESILTNDAVAVVPQRLAETWRARHAVAVLPIRERSLHFEYRLIWHERSHRDRGLQWLRETFADNVIPS